MRVMPAPDIDERAFRPGVQVVLNESLNVVEVLEPDRAGEVVKVKDRLGDDRVIVVGQGDEEYVAHLAGQLLSTHVRAGDNVLFDGRAGVATELLPKEEVEELVLEEIPDVSYETSAVSRDRSRSIRDAVELPFLYAELFAARARGAQGRAAVRTPGCGKTLIAKAVASRSPRRSPNAPDGPTRGATS